MFKIYSIWGVLIFIKKINLHRKNKVLSVDVGMGVGRT